MKNLDETTEKLLESVDKRLTNLLEGIRSTELAAKGLPEDLTRDTAPEELETHIKASVLKVCSAQVNKLLVHLLAEINQFIAELSDQTAVAVMLHAGKQEDIILTVQDHSIKIQEELAKKLLKYRDDLKIAMEEVGLVTYNIDFMDYTINQLQRSVLKNTTIFI